jgi:hypothetical protein
VEAKLQQAASAAVVVEQAGGKRQEVGVRDVAVRLLIYANE